MKKQFCKHVAVALVLAFNVANGAAQTTNSTYFLQGVESRTELNPAFVPNRGYIKLPVLGSFNLSASSSFVEAKTLKDIFFEGEKNNKTSKNDVTDSFLKDEFIKNLKDKNTLNLNLHTDVLSFGWFKGKGFWNVNVGLKTQVDLNIPQSMFKFMQDAHGLHNVDWLNYSMTSKETELNLNSYAETGIGYAHPIGKRLTVGGKVKMLWGLSNAHVKINDITINTKINGVKANQDWEKMTPEELQRITGTASFRGNASVDASIIGLKLINDKDGKVKEVKGNGQFGLAGLGVGVDLGAEYKLTNNLVLSASVTDLGFISWKENASYRVVSEGGKNYVFNLADKKSAEKFRDALTDQAIFHIDMFLPKEQKAKARKTSLHSTLMLGAEYRLLKDHISLGVMYKNRNTQPKKIEEIMFSSAFKLNKALGFSVVYSKLTGGMSSFGGALKLGSFVVSSDYVNLTNKSKALNFSMGIAVPIGAKKKF